MTQESTTNISKLTELLAAHGVYALTIIFIFYQQWRADRSLKVAAPKDHEYFKKVYTSVVAATYTLVVVSTAVWIYATFVYSPRIYVRGSVSGLTDQVVSPQKRGDPARISETIAPDSSFDVDLYQIKKTKNEGSSEGIYDLGWVLMPRENLHNLVFRFQHRYEEFKSPSRQFLGHLPGFANVESKSIEKTFTVDLRKINYSAGSLIELMYQPNPEDKVQKIGKIYLREHDSDNLTAIPWEEITPSRKIALEQDNWLSRSALVVYAASENSPFRENGGYDQQFGRVLEQRLSDSDLGAQLAARKLLVENGKRSFKFILDTLKSQSGAKDDAGLLISNLASAVVDIESAGTPVPRDLYIKLAEGFRESGDIQSSAQFFSKAGDKQDDPKQIRLDRGIVYFINRQYDAAIRNLRGLIGALGDPREQALIHRILGDSYQELGHSKDAIDHYKEAINLGSDLSSYNNLAYLYAEQGTNLQEALRLVSHALALEKDPDQIAAYKDTKGWILHKMGRQQEALSLLKEAAARIPDNPEIRDHLKAVQDSIRAQ